MTDGLNSSSSEKPATEPAGITEGQALDIARERWEKEGWKWPDNVSITKMAGEFCIRPDPAVFGCIPAIAVNAQTGAASVIWRDNVWQSFWRRLFRSPSPPISPDQAVDAARAYCEKIGWPWCRPSVVEWGEGYRVYPRGPTKGSGEFILVSKITGEVLGKRVWGKR